MKTFFDRLKSLQNGMNTSEFSRFLGVKQQTLDKYIKGRKPSVEFVVTVCHKCGKSADWLLGLVPDDEPSSGAEATARKLVTVRQSLSNVIDAHDSLSKAIRCLERSL